MWEMSRDYYYNRTWRKDGNEHSVPRLADTKEGVRAAARGCVAALGESRAAAPRSLLARLTPALQHKAAHTREEALRCIGSLLHA